MYLLPAIPAVTAVTIPIVVLVLAVYLAIAVQNDATARLRSHRGLFLIGHWGWFFVVLLSGGLLGTFGYWLIHYSTLSAAQERTTTSNASSQPTSG